MKELITVIIPIYNQEASLERLLNRIIKEYKVSCSMQILLVDDGSDDCSGEICRRFAASFPDIEYIYQVNHGVSAARNLGIKKAKGKYIFFLDADDELTSNTLENVTNFFDQVYDQVDLVTYPIDTIYNEKHLKPHFRYQFLQKSGVYDLKQYPYIGQTTMNIAVKNRFEQNILFDEAQTFSEDQKYCCEVLKDKLVMGFCNEGKYIYYRSKNSVSGRLAGACFIFEQCMDFFERLFADYNNVPAAFQGLYVNDVYWKLCSNILFPHHYDTDKYKLSVHRISALLQRCDVEIILQHPAMDFFEKYFLLRLRSKDSLRCVVNSECYSLWNKGQSVLSEKSMEMVITRVYINGYNIEIEGFLKTVFFQFYENEPTLCVVENRGKVTRKLSVFPSAHNYYLSHEKTQNFWAMKYTLDSREVHQFYFEVEVNSRWFPVHYYFMPLVPFSHTLKRYEYQKDRVFIHIDENNIFHISELKQGMEGKRIWLYYDCKGVASDNGLIQFEHDILMQDGVSRYYVISDKRQSDNVIVRKHGVVFGSRKHKKLLLKAEKVITAYIEENNIFPFDRAEYDKLSGQFHFEIVYLQHGVLHIDMPWKYSPEKIVADKIVVSTVQEAQLYIKNGFSEEKIWKVKMPRLDFEPSKYIKRGKILWAPSWRSYLVEIKDNCWSGLDEKFLNSTYYKKIISFLKSKELQELLEKYGYYLDFKLHPIFHCYEEYFDVKADCIHCVNHVDEYDYEYFITDFSSYLYDFLYRGIPVASYIPDFLEFKSGMNGYRNLNYGENFWENVCVENDELLVTIEKMLVGTFTCEFQADFCNCDNSKERIYSLILEQ